MPTLEWIGKDKVVNHHLDMPFRCWSASRALIKTGSTAKISAVKT